MHFSDRELEYYHNSGKIPDWAYYQLNENDINRNYQLILDRRNRYELDSKQIKDIENYIKAIIEHLLENLL